MNTHTYTRSACQPINGRRCGGGGGAAAAESQWLATGLCWTHTPTMGLSDRSTLDDCRTAAAVEEDAFFDEEDSADDEDGGAAGGTDDEQLVSLA